MLRQVSYCTLLLLLTTHISAAPKPYFPFQQGWLGGDAAYSIKIDEKRTLWLFGDTFINTKMPGAKTRAHAKLIDNSIALQSCDQKNNCDIKYYWRTEANKPAAFFKTNNDYHYWPRGGFTFKDQAYLFLLKIKRESQDPFGFKIMGSAFVTIKLDSTKSPVEWQIAYQNQKMPKNLFSFDAPHIVPGMAIAKINGDAYTEKDYLYLLSEYNQPASKTYLLRIKTSKLSELYTNLEYLTTSDNWLKLTDINKYRRDDVFGENHDKMPKALMQASTEGSLTFNPHKKLWEVYYSDLVEDGILVRTAKKLGGPWSKEKLTQYMYPELDKKSSLYHKDNFCYAGKKHSLNQKSIISYVCNNFDSKELLNNLSLYVPKVFTD